MERMELSNVVTDISGQNKTDFMTQNQSCREREEVQNSEHFSLRICKCYTLKIFKPLIPLKIMHFLWHAISTIIWTFFIVYLKQDGITLQELFICYTLVPVVQVLSMSIFSVLIDKFGHAKVYLISGLLVSGSLIICILHLPSLKEPLCRDDKLLFECKNETWTGEECGMLNLLENITHQTHCQINCSSGMDSICGENNLTCLNSTTEKNVTLSITRPTNSFENDTDNLYFIDNSTGLPILCDSILYNSCNLTCPTLSKNYNAARKKRHLLGAVYIVLIVALLVTYVNTYRFLDISAQVLIKRHKTDYGHVRIWGNMGRICGPIFAGFVVHLASFDDTTNYSSCLYYYSITCLLSACVAYKMDICGVDRGRDMCKKTRTLIKSPDILVFYMVLMVLGTSWAFCEAYRVWYLAELGASSFIFSLLDVLRHICGMIVLFNSKWILDKIGEKMFLLLSLMGYAVYQFSFSFLQTAWPAVFIELIRIFSHDIIWVAVIYHCIQIAPKGLEATVTTSAGLLHFTFGRFMGGIVAGALVTNFGGSTAFQIMGLVNFMIAIAYAFYLFYRKRKGFAVTVVEIDSELSPKSQ